MPKFLHTTHDIERKDEPRARREQFKIEEGHYLTAVPLFGVHLMLNRFRLI